MAAIILVNYSNFWQANVVGRQQVRSKYIMLTYAGEKG